MIDENIIFVGKSIDNVQRQYENWATQYDDCAKCERDGYRFSLVKDEHHHRIVLYVECIYYSHDNKLYIMELSAMESFNSIEEAEARCGGLIEYYIRGRIIDTGYVL